jgi:hypothetical protein
MGPRAARRQRAWPAAASARCRRAARVGAAPSASVHYGRPPGLSRWGGGGMLHRDGARSSPATGPGHAPERRRESVAGRKRHGVPAAVTATVTQAGMLAGSRLSLSCCLARMHALLFSQMMAGQVRSVVRSRRARATDTLRCCGAVSIYVHFPVRRAVRRLPCTGQRRQSKAVVDAREGKTCVRRLVLVIVCLTKGGANAAIVSRRHTTTTFHEKLRNGLCTVQTSI